MSYNSVRSRGPRWQRLGSEKSAATAATRRRATAAASAAAKAARAAAAKAARAAGGDFSWCGIRLSADFLADMDDDDIAALIEGEEQAEEEEAVMRSLRSRARQRQAL